MRGAPPADVDAVVQAVMAIGRLMQAVPELTEIDVNPLMVHAKGQGATALDALIVTADNYRRGGPPHGQYTQASIITVAPGTGSGPGTSTAENGKDCPPSRRSHALYTG